MLKRMSKCNVSQCIINRFIGGTLRHDLDEMVERFTKPMHKTHCIEQLGDGYDDVHKKMDAWSGRFPGERHRLYGHSKDFIKQFKGRKRRAAQIHLLGDFTQTILPVVFRVVSKSIEVNKIESPYYIKIGSMKGCWDIGEKAIEKMIQIWSNTFVATLNSRNRMTK